MDSIQSFSGLNEVLLQFGIDATASIIPIQHGLINSTWKIEQGNNVYILQKVNSAVFKNPQDVADNISAIGTYLDQHHTDYIFTSPLKLKNNDTLYRDVADNYYRLFPFIKGSHTRNTVQTAAQAYEAAKQFGLFTAVLKDFDSSILKETIPFFHDLGLRYDQFLAALEKGNEDRIASSQKLISQLQNHYSIVEHFEAIKNDPQFKLRVTHHDTKISNVLLDENDKGICVIDLDTVMPGYFISDVGDMMRTYLSPVTEEEQDLDKVTVRKEIYDAIVKGYLYSMKDELSETEQQHFFYAGKFMIYMQALRFLTDHLNNDMYYGASYPEHNYKRAANQLKLLEQFMGLKHVAEISV